MKTNTETQRAGDPRNTTPLTPRPARLHQALRRCGASLCIIAALAACSTTAFGRDLDTSGPRTFKTFTANAYVGADLFPVVSLDPTAPGYFTNLLAAVTATYLQIVASDPPARLAGLAREIAMTKPEVLGLEEIESVETAPMTAQGMPGTFTVTYDYLQLLTNALAARGLHYTAVVISTEFDVALPMVDPQTGGLLFARLVDHEVILARADVPPGHLRVSNPQTGHYATLIQIPSIGFSQTRGWCSVDVFSRGETFRYICTHLEEEIAPPIQMAQAQELLDGPANIQLPVVIVGDFNADPLHRTGTTTFDQFVQAGFQDAWSAVYPRQAAGGLTWGHDAALADPRQKFVWRLDLILYRAPAFRPTGATVLDVRLNGAQAPLWPSDHAAVAAQFRLGNGRGSHQ